MPGYVIRALTKFIHPNPHKPQHAPHTWIEPTYGYRQRQPPTEQSSAPLLDEKETKRVQKISGTFLYYGRGVDPCILSTLNKIASEQAKPTTDTSEKCDILMDYLHTNPNAAIRYHTSDMVLKVVYDAAFFVLPKSRSRAADIYHLGWINNNKQNGLINVLFQTIKNVVASASEAEMEGIYLGAPHCCPIRIACIKLGHPQPANGTTFDTNNSTSHGILTSNMRSKLSKAFDMWYWWIKDIIKQNTFDLIWASGKQNAAGYFTKHPPPWHHKKTRNMYLQKLVYHVTLLTNRYSQYANSVRGCVTPGTPVHTTDKPFLNHTSHLIPLHNSTTVI